MSKLNINKQVQEDVKIRTIKSQVESNSDTIIRISDQLTKQYCKDLDNAIDEIHDLLRRDDEMTVRQLNYYISYLPVLMYYAGTAVEDLGIEGDTAKAIRQDAFNEAYLSLDTGTVQEKTSTAQQVAVNEQVVENAFIRAYKKAKNRIEVASTLHGSLKKVLQWRISELEVTRTNNYNGE